MNKEGKNAKLDFFPPLFFFETHIKSCQSGISVRGITITVCKSMQIGGKINNRMVAAFPMHVLYIYLGYTPIKYLDYTHGKHFIEEGGKKALLRKAGLNDLSRAV